MIFEDFVQHRIEEAKQNAKEKRQNYIQNIHGGNLNPLEIFPREIWEEVLIHVKEPFDIYHAHRSCVIFNDLLDDRRDNEVLLSIVIKEVPAFTQLLGDDLMKFRRVSRSLRDQVDNVLDLKIQEYAKAFNLYEWFFRFKRKLQWPFSYPTFGDRCPETTTSIKNLYEPRFGVPGGKRWPLRYLNIDMDSSNRPVGVNPNRLAPPHQTFVADVTSVLKLIGKELLGFHCTMSEVPFDAIEAYRILRMWISHVPNLIKVELELQCKTLSVSVNSKLRKFYNVIQRQPFPHLSNLSYLETGNSDFDEEMMLAIIKSNDHVKQIGTTWNSKIYDRLPHLQALSICHWRQLKELEESGLLVSQWQLKKLSIRLNCTYPSSSDCSYVQLLNFLDSFPTLEIVDLELQNWNREIRDESNRRKMLYLPNLKEIKFELIVIECESEHDPLEAPPVKSFNQWSSIDYLIYCKKLEIINWYVGSNVDIPESEFTNPDEMIEFEGCRTNLYESNIWDLFPNLRSLRGGIRIRQDDNSVKTYFRGERIRSNRVKNTKSVETSAPGNSMYYF